MEGKEHLIHRAFLRLLNVDSPNYHIALRRTIEEIGNYFDLDRIFIYYFCKDPTFMQIEAIDL